MVPFGEELDLGGERGFEGQTDGFEKVEAVVIGVGDDSTEAALGERVERTARDRPDAEGACGAEERLVTGADDLIFLRGGFGFVKVERKFDPPEMAAVLGPLTATAGRSRRIPIDVFMAEDERLERYSA